ncbi:MAG: hypothetical protein NZ895_04040 [Archaeoglobaceae archaeon]|nr:hypothetical protein [Archaeoglobaceae archaeon]MCX8152031.1 hypothetical protein [Archaeoglobaceae archaeon]MDW8013588.1 DUF5749 family beta-barrel protein [Archaeoglobaceae archaeon]
MDLICKFVYKNGKEFGESIDVYGNYLIVKVSADFIAVPRVCIKKVEEDKIHIEDFDEKIARDVGRRWIEEKSKPVSLEELKRYGFGEE